MMNRDLLISCCTKRDEEQLELQRYLHKYIVSAQFGQHRVTDKTLGDKNEILKWIPKERYFQTPKRCSYTHLLSLLNLAGGHLAVRPYRVSVKLILLNYFWLILTDSVQHSCSQYLRLQIPDQLHDCAYNGRGLGGGSKGKIRVEGKHLTSPSGTHPTVGSSARPLGLPRCSAIRVTRLLPSKSTMSILLTLASTTYSLLFTQSTARFSG